MSLQVPSQEIAGASTGASTGALRRSGVLAVLRRPVTAVSCGWLLLVIITCVGALFLDAGRANDQNLNGALELPNLTHLLGTDQLGRDILMRLIFGGGSTLVGAAQAVAIALVLGMPMGMYAGYFGGWVDGLASRYSDVLLSIPGIIVLMTCLAVFGGGQGVAMTSLGILLSASVMRLARATARDIRSNLYVDAAKVSGLTDTRIIGRHLLPHVLAPVSILASVSLGSAILIQAGLGFLGLGPPPPAPNWGAMIAEASQLISSSPWLLVPPGVVIILTVLSLNFLGDALLELLPQNARPSLLTRGADRERGSRARAIAAGTAADAPAIAAPPAGAPERDSTPVEGPLLSVRDLTVRFGEGEGFAVVDGVSFEVERAETVGLVGESGCGKTMTALALLGLVPSPGRVAGGSIGLGGHDLLPGGERAFRAVRGKRIGMVAQEPMVALDPCFRVGSLLREALRQHHRMNKPAAQARALELLSLVGIRDPRGVAGSFPHQLSGGMAQRVAIALALAGEPELLVADEPTTALDVTIQAEVLDLLRSLQGELGMSILMVTHDLGVVADICSRMIVMYAGQVVEQGSVDDVFARPRHPYTAALLRANPERSMTGRLLPTIPGSVPPPSSWPSHCRFASRCEFRQPACTAAPIPLIDAGVNAESRCIRMKELLSEGEPV
jgi:peptide/nickel transport system permease protein